MKSFKHYLAESQHWMDNPVAGDDFAINFREECLVETYIIEATKKSIVVAGDDKLLSILESYGCQIEEANIEGIRINGNEVDMNSLVIADVRLDDYPDFSDAFISDGYYVDGTPISDDDLEMLTQERGDLVNELAHEAAIDMGSSMYDHYKDLDEDPTQEETPDGAMVPDGSDGDDPIGEDAGEEDGIPIAVGEAEYQGRKVPLGKPMRGDVKKFKVYVKDPSTGNVKKVNFGHGGTSAKRAGQKTMKIKKSNPARRKSFRARHNCDNPGPRTKARYWSCRAW